MGTLEILRFIFVGAIAVFFGILVHGTMLYKKSDYIVIKNKDFVVGFIGFNVCAAIIVMISAIIEYC